MVALKVLSLGIFLSITRLYAVSATIRIEGASTQPLLIELLSAIELYAVITPEMNLPQA